MKKYFFYTDPTKVKNQTLDQAFGPAGSAGGKDKYRITNLHIKKANTKPPVIAVCDGMICVQEDGPTTYSIILKPNYQPPFDFPFIKYFIYKGVKKDSIVNGTSIDFSKKTDTPFIEDIYNSWKPELTNTSPITNSKDVLGLAYDASVSHTIDSNPTFIFKDDQPIDNFFYYPNENFQLPSVKAGDKIGEFATEFGFEIVLERLGYEPKIELARTFKNFIEVDTITDPLNDNNTWQVDDADYFLHWHAKEECLNYIDPCAFYGSFCRSKVFYMSGANKTKLNTPQEIYNDVLDKFKNKNKVYLNIKEDSGFSFNFFRKYSPNIRFSLDENANLSQNSFNFYGSGWPIFIINNDSIPPSYYKKSIKARVSLPIGENTNPLVYMSSGYVKSFKKKKAKHRFQLHVTTTGQTNLKEVNFLIPLSLLDEVISIYVGLKYFERYNANKDHSNSTKLLPNIIYNIDNLYRPHSLNLRPIRNNVSVKAIVYREEVLVSYSTVNGDELFVGNPGIAEDANNIYFFITPTFDLTIHKKQFFYRLTNFYVSENKSIITELIDRVIYSNNTKTTIDKRKYAFEGRLYDTIEAKSDFFNSNLAFRSKLLGSVIAISKSEYNNLISIPSEFFSFLNVKLSVKNRNITKTSLGITKAEINSYRKIQLRDINSTQITLIKKN
ncbi:hypothetical protein LPB136_13445 [Tenacibaculum todarodis]|uniref:Uncharacterized protein n=1 Tax=Tenacibaculum todarodis TaxID=1850252 RepID=A0A1L3JME0_9FLAO|nr:hypothetical protein [Tenacibaculum todarodis]APG66315.1 hypothetical protein LPB136_13445 [Tenacibaculum todarodis]